jgi:hypothetical protein
MNRGSSGRPFTLAELRREYLMARTAPSLEAVASKLLRHAEWLEATRVAPSPPPPMQEVES